MSMSYYYNSQPFCRFCPCLRNKKENKEASLETFHKRAEYTLGRFDVGLMQSERERVCCSQVATLNSYTYERSLGTKLH
jgi:hypothetical protein